MTGQRCTLLFSWYMGHGRKSDQSRIFWLMSTLCSFFSFYIYGRTVNKELSTKTQRYEQGFTGWYRNRHGTVIGYHPESSTLSLLSFQYGLKWICQWEAAKQADKGYNHLSSIHEGFWIHVI